jgi:hypothetical protein
MTRLNLFGLFAVSAMVVTYALEARHRFLVLAFGAACLLGSAYGFLQGAWPFGFVEIIWSMIAFRRWFALSRGARQAGAENNIPVASR